MCGRRWHRTNQGGEVAARTMPGRNPAYSLLWSAVDRDSISKWKTDRLAIIRLTRLKARMSKDVVRGAKTDEGAVVF